MKMAGIVTVQILLLLQVIRCNLSYAPQQIVQSCIGSEKETPAESHPPEYFSYLIYLAMYHIYELF